MYRVFIFLFFLLSVQFSQAQKFLFSNIDTAFYKNDSSFIFSGDSSTIDSSLLDTLALLHDTIQEEVCITPLEFNEIDSALMKLPLPYTFQRSKGYNQDPDLPKKVISPLYEVKQRNTYPAQRKTFLFYGWLISLAIFAIIRKIFYKKWLTYWKDFQNINIAFQNFRDQQSGIYFPDVLFQLLFLLTTSLCIEGIFYSSHNLLFSQHLSLFFTILIGVSLILVTRTIILYSFAYILPFGEQLKFYNYNLGIVNKLSIIFWLILLMFLISSIILPFQVLVAIFLIFIGLIVFLGWYKGIGIISLKKNDSEFIFILYFCAFEILLVMMLAKFLFNFFYLK